MCQLSAHVCRQAFWDARAKTSRWGRKRYGSLLRGAAMSTRRNRTRNAGGGWSMGWLHNDRATIPPMNRCGLQNLRAKRQQSPMRPQCTKLQPMHAPHLSPHMPSGQSRSWEGSLLLCPKRQSSRPGAPGAARQHCANAHRAAPRAHWRARHGPAAQPATLQPLQPLQPAKQGARSLPNTGRPARSGSIYWLIGRAGTREGGDGSWGEVPAYHLPRGGMPRARPKGARDLYISRAAGGAHMRPC